VAGVLEVDSGEIRIVPFVRSKGIPDETTKLMVNDRRGRPRAVVLCSSLVAPEMVARIADGARRARRALGPELGRAVLLPIGVDRIEGCSFAVLPIAIPLRTRGLRGALQRHRIRPAVFRWLRLATAETLHEAASAEEPGRFRSALEHLASLGAMPGSIRKAAEDALGRLATGAWSPVHVLMHGDLWLGNVMIDPRARDRRWADRFVVIDWPSAAVDGYPVYDLIRLARSLRCSNSRLRTELEAHLEVLGGGPEDARSYLLSALGHVGMRLEHFPLGRYVEMSRDCIGTLEGALR
jgi:hypothetical protein